jgi:hypothetical protein
MKLWKKIAIIFLVIILLVQLPFVYNRYKFGQLSGRIGTLASQRNAPSDPRFNDYKGIIHAHTALGGHSTGTFDELIAASSANRLDFVVMTEHTSELFDSLALTLHGNYNGVLFVGGQEVPTATDRFLLIPGAADSSQAGKTATPDFLLQAHAQNKLALITYPEKFKTWDADFDGIEIFSLHTNAKKMNPFFVFFDSLWSYHAYPELVLAKYFVRPDDNLRQFDELAKTRRLTAVAGADAHSNIGFHLLGDDAGNRIINLKFDSYETIFRLVRNHVLLEKDKPLSEENLLKAIKEGRSFIAFDVLSDATGFSFTAASGAESRGMGDEISLTGSVNLKANAPLAAHFKIFKNGEPVFEADDVTQINFEAKETGAYRTEVYLKQLGAPFDRMPWIISNPIYIK